MTLGAAVFALLVCTASVARAHGNDDYPQGRWAGPGETTAERPQDGGEVNDNNIKVAQVLMPGASPKKDDEYICTGFKLNTDKEQYITGYEALARGDTAHHMLLFGCNEPAENEPFWKCGRTCGGSMGSKILYAWAKNAPPSKLPEDVGFRVGGDSGINYLVLQIHYRYGFPEGKPADHSGFQLMLDPRRQKYIGGVYLLYSNHFNIPMQTPKASTKISCQYKGETDLHPFAFRVHTHTLGKVVTGYLYNGTWNLLGKGNPQWPQAFYPMKTKNVVKPGDYLAGRCTYDSSKRDRETRIGSTHNDEMCNFYMMYYTTAEGGNSFFGCGGDRITSLEFPAGSDVPLPPNPDLEEVAKGHLHSDINVVAGWPGEVTLGQVGGMAVDSRGQVYVFHRGPVKWVGQSFDVSGRYNFIKNGPIKEATILVFDSKGKIVKKWGENMFYMPHGLHIDHEDNVWVTDVALHQVMKFTPEDHTRPQLTLGTQLEPGHGDDQFCKPTDVAVARNGEFYVTDGYCNSRVMKFSADGKLIKKWGTKSSSVEADGYPAAGTFSLPHSVTLIEGKNTVCVADRENNRIQCFDLEGNFLRQIHPPMVHSPIYGISYCPQRDVLYAVNGAGSYGKDKELIGFTVNTTGSLLETWSPSAQGFGKPHDVAVSPSGRYIYVGEIGPNKIWKFELNTSILAVLDSSHLTVKKDGVMGASPGAGAQGSGVLVDSRPEGSVDSPGDEGAEEEIKEEEAGDLGPSLVIGALLIIPVIVIVSVTVFLRLKKNAQARDKGYIKVTLPSDDSESEDD